MFGFINQEQKETMMKKIALASAMLTGLIALTAPMKPIRADEGGEKKWGREFSVDERLEKMTKKLNLTTDQQASFKTILEQSKTKMDAIREQMKSLHEDTQEKIRGVLTDDQKKKFDEMKKERKEHMEKEHQMKDKK